MTNDEIRVKESYRELAERESQREPGPLTPPFGPNGEPPNTPELGERACRSDPTKLLFQLIPPEAEKALATILTYGAMKYTKHLDLTPNEALSWVLKELGRCVKDAKISHTRWECVDPATRSTCEKLIQSTLNGSGKTVVPTHESTQIRSAPCRNVVAQTLTPRRGTTLPDGEPYFATAVSANQIMLVSWKLKEASAPSVEGTFLKSPTWITTIQQGSLEVFCALDATMDSGSLVTLWRVFKELFPIFNARQLQNTVVLGSSPDRLHVTVGGARNWEKGLPWSETIGSLRRHLNAFMSGETIDPESGLPHVYFMLTNAAFLVTMVERRPDLNDLPWGKDSK